MTIETFETGTIRQVHRYLTDIGYLVSEYAIRRWIKQGIIPAAYSGSTAYTGVSWTTVHHPPSPANRCPPCRPWS